MKHHYFVRMNNLENKKENGKMDKSLKFQIIIQTVEAFLMHAMF